MTELYSFLYFHSIPNTFKLYHCQKQFRELLKGKTEAKNTAQRILNFSHISRKVPSQSNVSLAFIDAAVIIKTIVMYEGH